MEFSDQSDGLFLGEDGSRSSVEEGAVTQGLKFVVLRYIEFVSLRTCLAIALRQPVLEN